MARAFLASFPKASDRNNQNTLGGGGGRGHFFSEVNAPLVIMQIAVVPEFSFGEVFVERELTLGQLLISG
jgi:hypothetical protein